MKEYIIGEENAGKRLDRWLLKSFPSLPMSLAQKALRTGGVRLNGRKASGNARLAGGDKVEINLDEALLVQPRKRVDPLLSTFRWHLDIVWEDENVLIVDKKPGLVAHPDRSEQVNTLLTHIQAYLYQKGAYDSADRSQFAPALCNRIDRFTGGLVIAAKNIDALKEMNRRLVSREVKKEYLCVIRGEMFPPKGVMDTYILKREGQRKVVVSRNPIEGAQRAMTGYETLAVRDGLSLMKCDLMTGRTHQIRAQFAWFRHPLLGDGQYGDERGDALQKDYQALYAWRLGFDFEDGGGVLAALNGRTFTARNVPFVRMYFPEFDLGGVKHA